MTKQSATDLDSLYADAARALPALASLVSSVAAATNGATVIAPLKGRVRAEEKIQRELDGDVSAMLDVCRASIVFASAAELRDGLAALCAVANVVRMKDRFAAPICGYRDILLNVVVDGHICEVQLHVAAILEIKNGLGHQAYEIARAASDDLVEQFVAAIAMATASVLYERAAA